MYCAPERLYDGNLSYASDMWSYMCLFFELYTNCCLFPGYSYVLVTLSMVNILGPLPVLWNGSYYVSGLCDAMWYN